LGTAYGGWNMLAREELAYRCAILCGAGEDISFDLALARRSNCRILIVDPTPRAVAHFEQLRAAFSAGRPFRINNSSNEFYDSSGVNFERIDFVAAAVWNTAVEG
jgi:hypothetical protein